LPTSPLKQGRVPFERFLERPRGDELGHPVQGLGIFTVVDLRPEFLEYLVGDSTAEKGVTFTQVLQGIALGLLVEVAVAPSALLELPEPSRVLDNAIERDQRRDIQLAHSCPPIVAKR
jgi:hypothetical protein